MSETPPSKGQTTEPLEQHHLAKFRIAAVASAGCVSKQGIGVFFAAQFQLDPHERLACAFR